jgi:hypothetical protein
MSGRFEPLVAGHVRADPDDAVSGVGLSVGSRHVRSLVDELVAALGDGLAQPRPRIGLDVVALQLLGPHGRDLAAFGLVLAEDGYWLVAVGEDLMFALLAGTGILDGDVAVDAGDDRYGLLTTLDLTTLLPPGSIPHHMCGGWMLSKYQ